MKTLSKIAVLIISFIGFINLSQANQNYNESDSIVINYGKGSRVVIYIANEKDIASLSEVDFNKIMESVSEYLDSAKRAGGGTFAVNDELASYKIIAEESRYENTGLVNNIFKEINYGIKNKKYNNDDDDDDDSWRRRRYYYRGHSHKSFGIELGLNSFLEDGSIPSNTNYELRPLGSRYVALDWRTTTRMSKNFGFVYGISVSWYNFMFEGNRKVTLDPNENIIFEKDTNSINKSKLTTSFVNIPIMFKFATRDFRLGIGGYAGYRLGAHSKVKYENNNDSNKKRASFNLNNFRYGFKAEIGIRNVTIFGTYDVNELFKNDEDNPNIPKLNAFTFGFRI